MSDLRIDVIAKPFDVTLAPPGSKSLTNRALVLAALADGLSQLSNVLFADDTLVMLECLGRLGFEVRIERADHTVFVRGHGGKIPNSTAELFCGNSGTTIRFLTALCAMGTGVYTLDGIPRMRQRPIGELVELLTAMGANIEYMQSDGFPPIRVNAKGLAGGVVSFGGAKSSQFLSAALQVAPYCETELKVDLGPQTSWPYVSMTMRVMDEFGSTPHLIRDKDTAEPKRIIIPQDPYVPTNYVIEPDASNAMYFLAAAAIHPGSKVTVPHLGTHSVQGDVQFVNVLRRMGGSISMTNDAVSVTGTEFLEGIDIDLSAMPDQAQTLGVVALFADGPTTIRGLHTLRVKETDRIAGLATELQKLGATVEIDGDDITITPPKKLTPAEIDTYDDHRMAMSFSLAGTRSEGVTIKDIACVNKTYPNYFEDLNRLR